MKIVLRMAREGGLLRFYKGLTAAWAKVMPSAAVSLLIRDAVLGRIS